MNDEQVCDPTPPSPNLPRPTIIKPINKINAPSNADKNSPVTIAPRKPGIKMPTKKPPPPLPPKQPPPLPPRNPPGVPANHVHNHIVGYTHHALPSECNQSTISQPGVVYRQDASFASHCCSSDYITAIRPCCGRGMLLKSSGSQCGYSSPSCTPSLRAPSEANTWSYFSLCDQLSNQLHTNCSIGRQTIPSQNDTLSSYHTAASTSGYVPSKTELSYIYNYESKSLPRFVHQSSPQHCHAGPLNHTIQTSYSTSHNNYQQEASAVPTPRQRITRPRLSISPIPDLTTEYCDDDQRNYQKCQPLQYRRYIEQNLERIFKYLDERQKRMKKNYDDLDKARAENFQLENIEKTIGALMQAMKQKETMYLRSLRAKLTVSDFVHVTKLGAGYIGEVTLVRKVSNKQASGQLCDEGLPEFYAMKKLRKNQVRRDNKMAHVKAERDILAEANNDWIVKLYYSFQDKDYLYLIMEFIQGGDMITLLQNRIVFSADWARFYIAEISLAVQFVHDKGIIHRDIKPDNILIDKSGHIKLTDFGLCAGFRWTHDPSYYNDESGASANSKHRRDNSKFNGNLASDHPTITKALELRQEHAFNNRRQLSCVGSPSYIAPEVLMRSNYSKLCDWWSVGVILYEMVVGYCPFIGEDTQYKIIRWRDYLTFPQANKPNQIPDADGQHHIIHAETISLMNGLLCEQERRLCGSNGIEDMQNHFFFRGVNWQELRNIEAPYVPKLIGDADTSRFPLENYQPFDSDSMYPSENSTMNQLVLNDFTYRPFSHGVSST